MSEVNCSVEYCTVETSDGVKLHTRIFNPEEEEKEKNNNITVVLVHPYSILGGCQALLIGIASGLAARGYKALTFDMRGVGPSTGKASLTGFKEIEDVIAVCRWASCNLSAHRILLVGSSAVKLWKIWIGFLNMRRAPIAGSAVDKIEQVVGYMSLGYPFGLMSSILFGRHHKAILKSPKPKLFVMGTRDGFTSVKQLKRKLKSAVGRTEIHLLEGVSHFEMEGRVYDNQMVSLIIDFVSSL
ncbi:hypothetical protein CASFOL_008597 [Castilleja foliolosa]|uniref:Xaa-Pro dipeptidyl-peptidase-like domain-containing protein n=1 Tax=Castilleja foliolosa TaxID=1961234 RepID=A0ABD3E3G9_9LAMI